jgi:crotonobetainyl-CoA:carnitine CoA-transferase CaiB-like acyl-CoA transferase
VTALYGILGACIGRLRHGAGQYLETSLLEAGLAWTPWEFGAWFGGGEIPTATGTRHRRSAPYQAYRTGDGYVTVGAGSEKLWRAFCTQVCDKPEWLADARFSSLSARLAHVDELEREIEAVFRGGTTAHWVELLDAAGVPGGPVLGYDRILQDEHIAARRMVVDIEHPRIGPMKTIGLPIKSSGELMQIRRPAPWLGQHTREILRGLGYTEADAAALFDAGAVFEDGRGE